MDSKRILLVFWIIYFIVHGEPTYFIPIYVLPTRTYTVYYIIWFSYLSITL